MRSVDFYLQYDETILDFHSKCLDDYDILPSTVIQVMESNINLTICLPTGNDKVFSISKQKKVSDLKETDIDYQFYVLLDKYNAKMLGISRSYVSRIETKAIGKLSKEFEK